MAKCQASQCAKECFFIIICYQFCMLSFSFCLTLIAPPPPPFICSLHMHTYKYDTTLSFLFACSPFFFSPFARQFSFMLNPFQRIMKLWNSHRSFVVWQCIEIIFIGFSEIFYGLLSPLFSTLIRLTSERWSCCQYWNIRHIMAIPRIQMEFFDKLKCFELTLKSRLLCFELSLIHWFMGAEMHNAFRKYPIIFNSMFEFPVEKSSVNRTFKIYSDQHFRAHFFAMHSIFIESNCICDQKKEKVFFPSRNKLWQDNNYHVAW